MSKTFFVDFPVLKKDFFFRFFAFFVYFYLVLFVYDSYLVDLYDYRGARYLDLNVEELFLVLFVSLISSFICPSRLKSPGDIFLSIYTVAGVPVSIILSGASIYKVEYNGFYSIVILSSLFFIAAVNKIKVKKSNFEYVFDHGLIKYLLFLNAFAIFLVVFYTKDHFSFDYNSYPVRRENAKLSFPGGALRSYFISIFIQALYPFFIILSCLTKKYIYILFSLLNVAVLWGGFGEKFPVVVSVFIFLCFYIYARKGSLSLNYLFFLFVGLILIGVLEGMVSDYSYVNDYLLRRIYAVPSVLNDAVQLYVENFDFSYYCDSIIGKAYCYEESKSVTYLLSSSVLNLSEMNANVNFIAMAYLRMGYIGVFIETIALMLFIFSINYAYYRKSNLIMVSIGLLLGIRLIEQALLTSLFSSGVFFLYLFAFFSIRKVKLDSRV